MTILTSSFETVVAALIKQWGALNLTDSVTGDPIPIYDGYPGPSETLPNTFVQIGGIEEITAEGGQTWASLGNGALGTSGPTRDESYAIRCAVSSFVGGTDALGTQPNSDAQSTARTNAMTIVNAIEVALREDPKLAIPISGSISGVGIGTGWVSFGNRTELYQTWPGDPDAGKGRTATFVFEVSVDKHRLYGS